jgi:hypothetical protein
MRWEGGGKQDCARSVKQGCDTGWLLDYLLTLRHLRSDDKW